MVKQIIGISLILLTLTIFSPPSFGQGENDSIIIWNESIELNWSDFEGSINDANSLVVWADAVSYCNIHFENEKTEDSIQDVWYVVSYFNPSMSWVKKDKKTSTLLEHERIHFDIYELYARKIRKILSKLMLKENDNISVYYNEIVRLINECHEMNQEYDDKTSLGSFDKEQNDWKKKIKNQIMELDLYACPYVKP